MNDHLDMNDFFADSCPHSFNPLKMAKKKGRIMVQSKCNMAEAEDEKCMICLTAVINKTVLYLPCTHFFHKQCLYQAFDASIYACPLCRFDLKPYLPSIGIRVKVPVEDAEALRNANMAAIAEVLMENISDMSDETIMGFLQHYMNTPHTQNNTIILPFYYTASGIPLPLADEYPRIYYPYREHPPLEHSPLEHSHSTDHLHITDYSNGITYYSDGTYDNNETQWEADIDFINPTLNYFPIVRDILPQLLNEMDEENEHEDEEDEEEEDGDQQHMRFYYRL